MRQPPDKWTVYGTARRELSPQSGWRSITQEFECEGSAWAYLITLREQWGDRLDCALIHTTHRLNKVGRHWRQVNTVIVRYGNAKGWWE